MFLWPYFSQIFPPRDSRYVDRTRLYADAKRTHSCIRHVVTAIYHSLWLSLICMIPFDLEQLDDPDHVGETANVVEAAAKEYLGRAGLEREGSVILLSRFYMRCSIPCILLGIPSLSS